MKKYILVRPVYNDIEKPIPIGAIVKINNPEWEFEVVEGNLKGVKGYIADGVNGYLVNDTISNRLKIKKHIEKIKLLKKSISHEYSKFYKKSTLIFNY